MEIYNYMEDVVKEELEKLLLETPDVCKCQKCKLDMIALVLNRLPPKYVVTEKGRFYTKLKEQEIQSRVDVTRELTQAIIKISKNPHH